MSEIKTFTFEKEFFNKIKKYEFGHNWPVVYIIEDGKEIYIGETVNAYSRSNQHYENLERRKLSRIHIISDEEYNKSATLDIESLLIQYMSAENTFILQNGNHGLLNHNYYDRQRYQAKFEVVWQQLKDMYLVKKDLIQIKNSDLFKYSPYKALEDNQLEIVWAIIDKMTSKNIKKKFIVHGGPGTGKSIIAIYLLKFLKELDNTKNMEIALVIPMTSFRNTLKKIFKNVKGLKPSMVIGPNEVTNKNYDLLIVDESHRLRRRKNITNYKSFDETNKLLGFDKNGTELDWILKSSTYQIFFYDENQTVRPSDVKPEMFKELNAENFILKTQLRIAGEEGEKYINFIQDTFDLREVEKVKFSKYDFKIYDDIKMMYEDIKRKNFEMGLCRMISGYAWPWVSKKDPNKHDIEIDGFKLFWNSVNHNWVNSQNSINEVGCIHTVQGYDLNYAGVIIGPELSYDKINNKFIIHKEKYMDANGSRGIDDPKELEKYIINIYKTLLTRGIIGTYVFIVDRDLREYFKNKIQ